MKKICFVLLIFFTTVPSWSQQNFFDPVLVKSIVLLEKSISDDILVPHGTGFLLYNYDNHNESYVITNEHVLRNRFIYVKLPISKKFQDFLIANKKTGFEWARNYLDSVDCFRNMTKEEESKSWDSHNYWRLDGMNIYCKYELIQDSTFKVNKDLDIGVFKIYVPGSLVNGPDTLVLTESNAIPISVIKRKKDIELGAEVYFLGFPFEIGTSKGDDFSDDINNPVLRTGIIAWKSENNSKSLLDAFSYSGNSGSPVFTKSDLLNGKSYLIGIINGHLSQIGVPEGVDINFGLATFVWSDEILKLLEKNRK